MQTSYAMNGNGRWTWFFSAPLPWRIAYTLTLFLPWILIFERGVADISTVLIGILFLWKSFKEHSWAWCRDPVLRVAFAAWLWLILITPFAVTPTASLTIALPWIRYLILYAALRYWVLVSREPLQWLSYNLFLMLGLAGIDTLWQYFTGVSLSGHPTPNSGRLTGPMDTVKIGIFISKLLLPPVGILLYFSLANKQPRHALACVLFLLTCVTIIILSGERNALLSTLLATTLATLLLMTGGRRLRIAGLTLIAALSTIFVVLLSTQSFVQKRAMYLYDNLGGFERSSYGQLFYVGMELGKSHWATGTGLKGFRILCLDFKDAGKVTHCNLHPHNPYIEWFAETGLMGLLLFISMVGLLLRECLRALPRYKDIARIIPATVLGVWVINFFPLMITQSNFSNWPAILLWYSTGVAFAMLNIASEKSA